MASIEEKEGKSYQAALQVAQQALALLLQWANSNLPKKYQPDTASEVPAVHRAKELLKWNSEREIKPLRLLFDKVCLHPNGQEQNEQHYYPMWMIANADPLIPYPLRDEPSSVEQNAFKQEMKDEILKVLQDLENWQNLSLLMLILEKYGSCLSFGESDVALIDRVKIAGAIAAALTQSADPKQAEKLSLIAGDLSGIQNFIYTIASDGALKSLRARSFYLELVTEEVVQQLLTALELPRTSIIYAGGGNLYLLAPGTPEEIQKVQQVQDQFNRWLLNEFQKKIFLALTCITFPIPEVTTTKFVDYWEKAIGQLNQQKTQKFADQINDILSPRHSYGQTCRVCHRDDLQEKDLQRLNQNQNEPDSPLACPTCRMMFQLGDKLFGVKSIVRSHRKDIEKPVYTIAFQLGSQPSESIYYHLFRGNRPVIQNSENLGRSVIAFLINNWDLEDYQFRYFQGNITPLLLGNYAQEVMDQGNNQKRFIQAEEMAARSQGIDRVGYLRMDVDRLGQIFARGLGEDYSLPKLAGLSRQMSYFFKVYLNSLASERPQNFLSHRAAQGFKALTEAPRQDLLFIYAGGDDLFISGAWNQVVEFAFDVYQAFRVYTGNHPDITLSGGVSLETPKFPLYQAASSAGEAEEQAKGNNRDSLGLFGAAFKWSEWLGTVSLTELEKSTKDYLSKSNRPPLLGIWNFVDLLQTHLSNSYKRSFVRNLLLTAQIQEQQLEEKKQAIEHYRNTHPNAEDDAAIKVLQEEEQDIRYYLHLPKIAYTLARLPSDLRQRDEFKPMRKSLLSPYNAPYFRAIATWIELLNRN